MDKYASDVRKHFYCLCFSILQVPVKDVAGHKPMPQDRHTRGSTIRGKILRNYLTGR